MLLRRKLLSVVLLTTLVAVVVALAAMVGYDLFTYHRTWVSEITAQAELLGRSCATALLFDDPDAAKGNLKILRFQPKVRAAAIYDARGALFARYAVDAADRDIPTLPGTDGARVEGRYLVVTKRIVEGEEILGAVYIRAEYELLARISNYAGISLAVMTLAMLVALVLSSRMQAVITQPILAVSDIARSVVRDRNYALRARATSDDEVGALVESFNGVLSEIQRQIRENDAFTRSLSREAEERRIAQEQVLRLNEGLEARVRDRTAQLQATIEELGLAKEAADGANQAKSAFLSSMSHELRTPLNAILGFGQLLANEAIDIPLAKRREFVEQILKAGRHLLALISEILDLSQIESGRLTLSVEPVSLSETILECQVMLEPLARQYGARVLYPASALMVLADRTRLKQVLLNLLSNAIKYGYEDAAVLVECTSPARGRVRIAVRDSGRGLSKAQMAALFQPFNRLGQEAGTKEGTGIGLVVTKRLVELMGGEIGVSSTVGVGSVFWIELNEALPEAVMTDLDARTAPARVASAAPVGELPEVLYVEDNPANLKLMEEYFDLRGDFRLISAATGHLGLALAREHLPRMIFLDLNLPDLGGSRILAILRRDARTARIPVVAVTARAMPSDIERGLAEGFFRYVTKPVNFDDLTDAIAGVDDLLARRESRPAQSGEEP
jgi:signal transduction histidine kinase/ActR/RegA family two-component response regulator